MNDNTDTTATVTTDTTAVAPVTAAAPDVTAKPAKPAKAKKATKKATKPAKAAKPSKSAKSGNGKVGRPRYVPTFPKAAEWTLRDFMVANGVNPDTGKGPRCSKLTLIKFLASDSERMGHSIVKRLSKTAEPAGDGKLGRKPFVYTLRAKKSVNDAAPEAAPAPAPAPEAGDVTVPVADIQSPAPAAEAVPAEAETVPAV